MCRCIHFSLFLTAVCGGVSGRGIDLVSGAKSGSSGDTDLRRLVRGAVPRSLILPAVITLCTLWHCAVRVVLWLWLLKKDFEIGTSFMSRPAGIASGTPGPTVGKICNACRYQQQGSSCLHLLYSGVNNWLSISASLLLLPVIPSSWLWGRQQYHIFKLCPETIAKECLPKMKRDLKKKKKSVAQTQTFSGVHCERKAINQFWQQLSASSWFLKLGRSFTALLNISIFLAVCARSW